MAILEGVVAFESLRETDVFNGQDTGKYSVTLTLDDDVATDLERSGVKLKDYEGKKQRKFASKYQPMVFDSNGNPFNGKVTYGSKVRIVWTEGQPHPVHGVTPYLNKLKVLELAENEMSGDDGEF
jgi:hypothetical protein